MEDNKFNTLFIISLNKNKAHFYSEQIFRITFGNLLQGCDCFGKAIARRLAARKKPPTMGAQGGNGSTKGKPAARTVRVYKLSQVE